MQESKRSTQTKDRSMQDKILRPFFRRTHPVHAIIDRYDVAGCQVGGYLNCSILRNTNLTKDGRNKAVNQPIQTTPIHIH